MALVTKFLSGIRNFVLNQDGVELANWLKADPATAGSTYFELARELKAGFPQNSKALEQLVDKCLPEEDEVPDGKGSPWPGFNVFLKDWLEYWRDTDFNDLVNVWRMLSGLLNSCANAFANPTYGLMLLQTSLKISESLSNLTMGLNRQPEILAKIQTDMSNDEGEERKSIVEIVADIIMKMFTSCLSDRSSARFARPLGKKQAIFKLSNAVFKLLLACGKSRHGVQMVTNLAAQGPPLSFYPASDRVTFLYYLGRFNFDHCDYWRAHLCLSEAYRQCPPQFMKHRRLIMTYWIPSNVMMGRFPTQHILGRPDAKGLAEIYLPIREAVRTGNFLVFHQALQKSTDYLWPRGIYLHLTSLKSLVWRSFTRKTYLITRNPSGDASDTLLDFHDLVTTASYVQKLLEGYVPAQPPPRARPSHINSIFMKAVKNSAGEGEMASLLVPPPGGPKKLMPLEGLIYGNLRPNVTNIENVISSLVYAGLMNGFVARAQQKFAIEGMKKTGGDPLSAGWPNVYRSIIERFEEDYEKRLSRFRETGDPADRPEELGRVPGWVRGSSGFT